MKRVKVKKQELLAKVMANREIHVKEYKEACLGYREQAIKRIDEVMDRLKRQVSALKEGEAIALAAVRFDLPVPESHKDDYDQVIAMLNMSVDDEIELDDEGFSQYVMDHWKWRQGWEVTKMSYAPHG